MLPAKAFLDRLIRIQFADRLHAAPARRQSGVCGKATLVRFLSNIFKGLQACRRRLTVGLCNRFAKSAGE
ncbi:hypothetical protein EKH55_0689 [Sinorhizobium alkalisoli]|nr:hypothetical protein EKH55_0689 [Sinorhizobium alkalisoli]